MLRIYLFGAAEVDPGTGETVPVATQKVAELLAYLWLHRDRPQSRTQLAGLLWPETDERRARQSLRTALHRLRQVLDPEGAGNCLITERQSVQFDPEAPCWVDVGQFVERLDQAADAAAERVHYLQEAVSFYRGDLLEDCYEDWCLEEREHLRNRYLHALEELVTIHAERKEYEPAIEYARQLLAVNPLQEEIHRQLMYLHYALDDRNAALHQYQECERLLADELGIEPLPETQALAREIEERVNPEHLATISPQAIIAKYPELGAPFVGRIEEFARLKAAWERASQGQGGSVFVSGEAGIGKTRLTQELVDLVIHQGTGIVLKGACFETEGRLPYQPWIEALRQALANVPDDTLDRLSTIWVGEVMKLVPELMERFPEVQPRPALASPEQEKNRLFEGLSRFLLELSQADPLLVVLDDLQWADESTLQVTHYLMRKLSEDPVCLIGVYRSGDVGEDHPLLDAVQHALKENIVETLELAPLTQDEVTELVGQMLKAGEGLEPLIAKITADAEGNPFFTVELIKSFIEAGAVRVREDGTWEVETKKLTEPDLPQTVRAVVETRLRRLSRPSREVAQLASTRTQRFDLEFLHEAIGHRREDVADPLNELLKTHFLVAEGPQYRFQHDVIREVIYRGLDDERRRHLHLQTGRTLETLRSRPDDSEANEMTGEVAEHFYQAGDWRKALDYSLHAGELAWSQSYAKNEALHFYQQALESAEHLDDDMGLLKAYQGIGEVCAFTDEPERGLESCERALKLCEDPVVRADIHCAIANVYHQRRELEEGLAHAEKALQELEPDHTETLTAVKAHYYASTFLNWLRKYDEAIERGAQAATILEENHPDHPFVGLLYSEIGHAYSGKGEPERATKYLVQAVELANREDDPYSVAMAYFKLALAHFNALQLEEAIAAWRNSLDSITRLSGRYEEQHGIYSHLTLATMAIGDIPQAREYAERQLENSLNIDIPSYKGQALAQLACLFDTEGDRQRAQENFNAALAVTPGDPGLYQTIILSYLCLQKVEEALHWLDQGLPYLGARHIQHLQTGPRLNNSFEQFRKSRRFQSLTRRHRGGSQ